MSLAHFPYVQSVKVTSRCRGLFSVSNYGRSNNNKRYCLVFAYTKKLNDLHLESKVETLLDSVKWDEKGLAVAIAQNVYSGAILMQGFVNRDALATTICSRNTPFYSWSRSTLWTKDNLSWEA